MPHSPGLPAPKQRKAPSVLPDFNRIPCDIWRTLLFFISPHFAWVSGLWRGWQAASFPLFPLLLLWRYVIHPGDWGVFHGCYRENRRRKEAFLSLWMRLTGGELVFLGALASCCMADTLKTGWTLSLELKSFILTLWRELFLTPHWQSLLGFFVFVFCEVAAKRWSNIPGRSSSGAARRANNADYLLTVRLCVLTLQKVSDKKLAGRTATTSSAAPFIVSESKHRVTPWGAVILTRARELCEAAWRLDKTLQGQQPWRTTRSK